MRKIIATDVLFAKKKKNVSFLHFKIQIVKKKKNFLNDFK